MPSTPSSASPPADSGTRPPARGAIALLVIVSIAIPLILLALILTHDEKSTPASSVTLAPDEQPTDMSKAKVGTAAPDFTLRSTTGTTVSLSELRGHPVVLAFFASWCHPCREELPVLQEFADRNGDRLRVLGVSFRDRASDSADFIRELKVTYPALVDEPSAPIGRSYGVRGIPQTIFIDAQGKVRGRVYGETSKTALQPAIDDLLAGKDIRPI